MEASQYKGSVEVATAKTLCKLTPYCVSSLKIISLSQNRRVYQQWKKESDEFCLIQERLVKG